MSYVIHFLQQPVPDEDSEVWDHLNAMAAEEPDSEMPEAPQFTRLRLQILEKIPGFSDPRRYKESPFCDDSVSMPASSGYFCIGFAGRHPATAEAIRTCIKTGLQNDLVVFDMQSGKVYRPPQRRLPCELALAYMQAAPGHAGAEMPSGVHRVAPAVSGPQAPVFEDMGGGLRKYFVIQEPEGLSYIKHRDLNQGGLSEFSIREIGNNNLVRRLDGKVRYRRQGAVFKLVTDGHFDASAMFISLLWDKVLASLFRCRFAVAIPYAGVLYFCDSQSEDGLAQLRQLAHEADASDAHFLTRALYLRRYRRWFELLPVTRDSLRQDLFEIERTYYFTDRLAARWIALRLARDAVDEALLLLCDGEVTLARLEASISRYRLQDLMVAAQDWINTTARGEKITRGPDIDQEQIEDELAAYQLLASALHKHGVIHIDEVTTKKGHKQITIHISGGTPFPSLEEIRKWLYIGQEVQYTEIPWTTVSSCKIESIDSDRIGVESEGKRFHVPMKMLVPDSLTGGNADARDAAAKAVAEQLAQEQAAYQAKCQAVASHLGAIYAVAFFGEGKRAISASEDKTLRIWDMPGGQCRQILFGHADSVKAVVVAGARALSGSNDGTMRLWDLDQGQCLRVFEGHAETVAGVAFSPDQQQALSASSDGSMRLWDLDTGECLQVLKYTDERDFFSDVAFHPNGYQILAPGGMKMRVWDLKTGKYREFTGKNEISCSALSSNGQYALSGYWDHGLSLWNVGGGLILRKFSLTDVVRSCDFSPNARQVMACSFNTIRIWDFNTGLLRKEILRIHGCRCARYSPCGSMILAAAGNELKLFDAASGAILLGAAD